MGTSVYANLVYGIDLGKDEQWNLKGLDEGNLASWWNEEEGPDFDEAEELLPADARVTLITYGHTDYAGWMLTTQQFSSGVWETMSINPADLTTTDDDERLRKAVTALGIEPTTQPSWLLCSDWG